MSVITNAYTKLLVLSLCCLLSACAIRPAEQATYAAGQVKEDLNQFLEIVASTHPDLGYSTDMQALKLAATRIRNEIDRPLTTRAAWRMMAELNPIFRDAHVGLQYPTVEFDEYRIAGGTVFPIAVYIDDNGALRVAETSAPDRQIRPHEEIAHINDIPAADLIREMSGLMRGETITIQRLVLAYNFAAYLWTVHGAQDSYTVTLRAESGETRELVLPKSTEPQRPGLGSNAFRYELLRPGIAHLEVQSFDIRLREQFRAFLQHSFARIQSDRIQKLIIDIRRNPGGAHELSDALLDYLADKPVRQASRLIARILEDNRDIAPDAATGDVVQLPWDEWLKPSDNPLRFKGESFLLIGPNTYSQAIVFAAVFEDFGLGTLVGEPTDGWANQTGQVRMVPLRHTGLLALAPRYVIVRPNGSLKRAGVQPNVSIADNPADTRSMINQLLGKLIPEKRLPTSGSSGPASLRSAGR